MKKVKGSNVYFKKLCILFNIDLLLFKLIFLRKKKFKFSCRLYLEQYDLKPLKCLNN
jgi:hypothetical protein